jgi:hypothetical protein
METLYSRVFKPTLIPMAVIGLVEPESTEAG